MPIIIILLVMICSPFSLRADEKTKSPTNKITVIDDSIFEEKKSEKDADTVEGVSGRRRYVGRPGKINADQQAELVNRCSVSNEKGTPGYRDCFNREQSKIQEGVKSNRDGVQQRMGASTNSAVDSLKSLGMDKKDTE